MQPFQWVQVRGLLRSQISMPSETLLWMHLSFGGTTDVETLTASGAVVVSMGTTGTSVHFHIAGVGAVTLDGGAATTGQVTITGVTAGGNVTAFHGAGKRWIDHVVKFDYRVIYNRCHKLWRRS